MTEKPKSNFELALEARQKKIDPKFLPSAARLIYRDSTISDTALAGYINPPEKVRTKQLQRPPAPMR